MERWKLCASTRFEILPLSTCTVRQEKSYISKGIQPIFEIFAWARRCWGWEFGWKVSGAQIFLFCNGKEKTLRIDNIWNFGTFNLYNVPAKILYLQRYSADFRNLCLRAKILRGDIWGNVSVAQVFYFCNGKLKTLRIDIISISHFQPVHCHSKNPISPKVFNRFSKSLPELDDVEGGHLGGKFKLRRYFTFAMARWKHCASTTFEIFPLSTFTVCQQKSYISKGIQPIFEFFASARRCWGWALWRKVSCAQVVYCCNGKAKTLRIDNIWNFATFNLYTVPAKTYITKGIHPVFEIFASARRCWGWALGGVFQVRRYFTFALARRKLCASKTFEILPLSTCTVCKQKSYISKGIQPIFEILAWARLCWGWAFGWKMSAAQVFYFCNGKVKTLRIDKIWNFATFNLYSAPGKILYLQRYSTDFRNLCLSSKMLRVGIWLESFRCADISLLQWQSENLAHRQHLKFWHFQPVHCASKNPISPKAFSRFSKSLPQSEDLERGHLGGMFLVRRYFTFATGSWKLCASTSFQFPTFNLFTVTAKIPYLQRYSTDFRNLCLSSTMLRVDIWVESFSCAGILILQWQGENIAHRQHLKFFHFQPLQCASKNPISQKVFNRFSNSLPQLEDVEGGHFGGTFHVRR